MNPSKVFFITFSTTYSSIIVLTLESKVSALGTVVVVFITSARGADPRRLGINSKEWLAG